jgi:hypothetical protein
MELEGILAITLISNKFKNMQGLKKITKEVGNGFKISVSPYFTNCFSKIILIAYLKFCYLY